MTQIEQIKAEIERLKKEFCDNPSFRTVRSETAKEFSDKLFSFIESMEKEQEVNLEKEIIRYKVPFSDDREYLNETTLDAIAHHFYELGLNAKDNAPKIKGWVARDFPSPGDNGQLHFFVRRPERKDGYWHGEFHTIYGIEKFFEELTFQDEPIEVELIIHRV